MNPTSAQPSPPPAFDDLVHRYRDRVRHYITKVTNSPEDAEDLTQEVFIRVYASMDGFRGDASLRTWIYRIAMNLCVDWRRGERRRVPTAFSLDAPFETEDRFMARDIADSAPQPDDMAERRELRLRVRQAVAKIRETRRAFLFLCDLKGLSYNDIARLLECPLGTVKSRLFVARAELAKRLQPYMDEIQA